MMRNRKNAFLYTTKLIIVLAMMTMAVVGCKKADTSKDKKPTGQQENAGDNDVSFELGVDESEKDVEKETNTDNVFNDSENAANFDSETTEDANKTDSDGVNEEKEPSDKSQETDNEESKWTKYY